MALTQFEIDMANGYEPYRLECFYCHSRFCSGYGCPEQVEAEMAEDRRQRQHEKNLEQLDALAIEKREIELIHKLGLEEAARVEKEIEQLRAEYEANVILLEKAREQELSDALQRAGAALENE